MLREFTRKPRGFVLVTGPTGSGKSTTLASMIDVINAEREEHILTIEDPIEFLHAHKRCDRQPARDRRRRRGLRRSPCSAALREDPDVILVGEMRDLETISTALTAAETGHLVFATLHTQSTAQTVDRIIDVFPPAAAGARCACSSRSRCRASSPSSCCRPPTAPAGSSPARCWCRRPPIRNLIREGKTHQIYSALQTSGAVGMQTMDADLAQLVRGGQDHRARSPSSAPRSPRS